MRAQRRHDLNRLLDEPGPGARFAVLQICLLEIARRDVLPAGRLSVNPFKAAAAVADARLSRWRVLFAGIQNEPTPQLGGAELPIVTAVCLTYTINAPL